MATALALLMALAAAPRAATAQGLAPDAQDAPAADVAPPDAAPADDPALAEEAAPAEPDAFPEAAQPPAASPLVVELAAWVNASDDHHGLPFVIVDKLGASLFVYGPDGTLLGSAPALVGLARGDDATPGIGKRPMSAIRPEERTTPAGRFVAAYGRAAGGRRVLWVDYVDAISLHPVVTSNPKEHRLARLKSAEPEDHRISYGCINVPATFYNQVVRPAFAKSTGLVYVLPDTKSVEEVFPGFRAPPQQAAADAGAVLATLDK
jgi:hypothetical protein